MLEGFPAGCKGLRKHPGRQMLANTRNHGFGRLAADIGSWQALAETAAPVPVGNFNDHRVALFAAVQRMAKRLVKRDAQPVNGQGFDTPRLSWSRSSTGPLFRAG